MTSKNKKQKDLELQGTYEGCSMSKEQRRNNIKVLKEAKKIENKLKEQGAKWVKTFKGWKLVKV